MSRERERKKLKDEMEEGRKKGECERFAMGKFESRPQKAHNRSQNCCIRRELNL